MKKLVLTMSTILLLAYCGIAQGATFFSNGLWWSNVCRTGMYFTVMPISMPVGSGCANTAWGLTGVVVAE